MKFRALLTSAAFIVSAAAQKFATYTDGSHSLSVNIPDSTASSGSGSVFFQISAPSGTQWLAFGIGSQMSNAQMFVIYSSGTNVVLSPRSASGEVMPTYDSSIKATVLSGSGAQSDGSMVVNIQCTNCNLKATDTSSSWIMAYKKGSSVGSTSNTATIVQHDTHNNFDLDLTAGVGGSSSNPFVASSQSSSSSASSASGTATSSSGIRSTAASSASGTANSSASQTASATNGISTPIASSQAGSSSASSSTSPDNTETLRSAHGIIMSILFIGAFPLFALTLYLPTAKRVRFIHAPLQGLSVILLIVAMALGIVLGQRIEQLDTYHQIIGFIVVFVLVLVQPTMGFLQHMHFHKTGGRSMWGPLHQGIGRGMIILGIVNGGLGWQLAGNTGAYVPYAVVAVIMFLIYTGVVLFMMFRSKNRRDMPIDKESKAVNGYEMQNTHRRLHSGNVESSHVQPKHDRS